MKYYSHLNRSLNHDFCPWANAYVYWLKKPIGWVTLAFVASLLLGVGVSNQAFLATAAIVALGIIGCLWPWIVMAGLRGELKWNQLRCEEGEPIRTTLGLTNRWPWPAWGMVIEADDAISSSLETPGQPICLSRVPAASVSDFQWVCKPTQRGCYPKKQVRLSTGFPFGIWTNSRKLAVAKPLIVWPKLFKLTDVPSHTGNRSNGIGSASDIVGDEGDWMGVRPYRPGDSLRQVHWAQTARRDSLVVFERQSRSRQMVSIRFDPNAAKSTSEVQREWMIRILASLTNHFLQHSWQVQAQLDEGWTVLSPGASSKQQWMDRLATWDHELHDSQGFAAAPAVRSSMEFVISTPSAALEQCQSIPSHERNRTTWILVAADEQEATNLDLSMLSYYLIVHVNKEPVSQLQAKWQRMCQRTTRSLVGA